MPLHVTFSYLRREDFSLEELDLDPDDFDSPRDELLLAEGPELTDLDEEDRICGVLIDLDDLELLPEKTDELLLEGTFCSTLRFIGALEKSEFLTEEPLFARTFLL
jgi:hypothetical protein